MALPSSGQLTLAQIRDEFGAGTTSNVNLRTLSAAAGLSQPDQFSDFYGLSAYTPPTLGSISGSASGSGTAASPWFFTQSSFSVTPGEYCAEWSFAGQRNYININTSGTYQLKGIFQNIVFSKAYYGWSEYYAYQYPNYVSTSSVPSGVQTSSSTYRAAGDQLWWQPYAIAYGCTGIPEAEPSLSYVQYSLWVEFLG